MEEHQLVIAQFEKLVELARQMESIPALVLEVGYSYQSFGSWWFEFKKAGWRYRLTFDGRDSTITLDDGGRVSGGGAAKWQCLISCQITTGAPAVAEVMELVHRAVPAQGSAARTRSHPD